jgi:transcriptional regulator with XRE-family HTH domain
VASARRLTPRRRAKSITSARLGYCFAWVRPTMLDRETFGPRLRRERERRGISLETIASVTKVSADLWDGLERNDFSRWPSGVFARAFVRDYARAIGLDGDDVVGEFCRLFPIGDRRANRLIKAQAELIGHQLTYTEHGALPPDGARRATARTETAQKRTSRAKYVPRILAAAIDASCTLGLSAILKLVLATSFWGSAGVLSALYFGVTTVMLGATPGTRVTEALRQRMPTLFAFQDRRRATA